MKKTESFQMEVTMDMQVKINFIEKWEKYFSGNELPIACYYADTLHDIDFPEAPKPNKHGLTCIFSQLAPVRTGKPRAFNQENLGCWGAKGLLGFISAEADEQAIDFIVNVERYKKTPEHVRAMFENNPPVKARGKYIIFKRFDFLSENDNPEVVFFFCNPDVLSGLHGLANYDVMDSLGVTVPFCSGCESIIGLSMKAFFADSQRAVIGLLDPSARSCVKPNFLSFSVPWPMFEKMVGNMDNCFLNTYIWEKIQKRF